ncbi:MULTISPECIES: tetratricopeptide repeat protein [Rhodomicrobium]|uniref:tetratricopeptide repeat protein n=1 Tax=Rhodomicrobium TaxID=1068 RepID=UPI000B4A6369|nr:MULTISPECIES: tetratricopeptide repeat protein [Rhodomicrobium]
MRGHILRLLAVGALALAAAGCKTALDGAPEEELTTEITDTSSFGSAPEAQWLEKAKTYYRNGNYGLAERYYRQAIEERHNNAEAWLGLAASYDRLKRFDHAERAYNQLIKLAGNTPTVLNNLAYHQMLKGDFAGARQTLQAAASQSPNNPYIRNNMDLLNRWESQAGGNREG